MFCKIIYMPPKFDGKEVLTQNELADHKWGDHGLVKCNEAGEVKSACQRSGVKDTDIASSTVRCRVKDFSYILG